MAAPPLVLLLLLLLPPALRVYLYRQPGGDAGSKPILHPLVLVPGVSCSSLEVRLTEAYRPSVPRCGARKGKGWFGLWENATDLVAHDYVQCFHEQMSLVYDPDKNEYRNLPGVETRVPHFGSSASFFHRNPDHQEWCLGALRHELEKIGYRNGSTLFGAPYDLRHAPPLPGQPSEVYAGYFAQLTELVETVASSSRKKVILFGHSFGGTVVLEFVRQAPMAWRDRYIKHLVLAAPIVSSAGFMEPVKNFASGTDILYMPMVTPLSMRPMWRSFESAITNFPSPAVFGDRPLVVTRQRNYTANDMGDFFIDAMGAAGSIVAEAFRRRQVPKMNYILAPNVPMTCINGVGNETPEQLVYWDGDLDAPPQPVYGDGDGKINLISILAFDEEMRQQPGQKRQFKSVKIPGATHSSVTTDESALKRLIQEILEANPI